ncbi:hypothetical protein GG344DRAFT_8138, partial [Lentinula edodes]
FQVEHTTLVAVRKGTYAVSYFARAETRIYWKTVGVRGKDKKLVLQLRNPRTVRKLAMLDNHVCLAFAG